jgi:hypothetical protein
LRDGRAASPAISIPAPVSPAAASGYGRGMDENVAPADIKLLIAAGAGVLLFTLFGLVPFITAPFIAAMAAVIGGIVLAGSNSTTWTQTEARLHKSEALRAEMIGRLELRVVEERPTLH